MDSKCYGLLQVIDYHSMGYLRFDCNKYLDESLIHNSNFRMKCGIANFVAHSVINLSLDISATRNDIHMIFGHLVVSGKHFQVHIIISLHAVVPEVIFQPHFERCK